MLTIREEERESIKREEKERRRDEEETRVHQITGSVSDRCFMQTIDGWLFLIF